MPAALKGLVLSGGAGTRLRPITHTSAKQLVPVANKPVLFYGLEALRAAGVTDIGIVVGDTRAEIEAAVGDGSALGIRVTYIPQEAPLGLAHAVLIAEAFLGDSPFVMYLGDNLLRDGITALVDCFRDGASDALILLQRVPDPESYGVAELEDGRVVRLVEKPAEPRSDLALVGVYMFSPSIMESVKAIRPSARGELEITDAIQHLIDRGLSVEPHEVTGWWKDTGRLEDMLEANRLVLDVLETRVDGELVTARSRGAWWSSPERAWCRRPFAGRPSSAPARSSSTPTSARTRRSHRASWCAAPRWRTASSWRAAGWRIWTRGWRAA